MNIKHRSKLEKEQKERELRRKKALHAFTPERDINNYCSKCKYRTTADYFHAETSYDKVVKRKSREHRWCCGYALNRRQSALKRINGEIVDSRGPRPGCLLFEAGNPKRDDVLRAPGRWELGRW